VEKRKRVLIKGQEITGGENAERWVGFLRGLSLNHNQLILGGENIKKRKRKGKKARLAWTSWRSPSWGHWKPRRQGGLMQNREEKKLKEPEELFCRGDSKGGKGEHGGTRDVGRGLG